MNGKVITNALPTEDPSAGVDLGRFVLLDEVPGNGETWFLARCFERLRKEGLCGVVSFSDPLPRRTAEGQIVMPGHVGTIYQAHNARYLQRSKPKTLLLTPTGKVFSPRAYSKLRAADAGWRYAARQLLQEGAPPCPALEKSEVPPREHLRAWLARALASGVLRKRPHPGNHKYRWVFEGKHKPNPISYPKTVDPEPALQGELQLCPAPSTAASS